MADKQTLLALKAATIINQNTLASNKKAVITPAVQKALIEPVAQKQEQQQTLKPAGVVSETQKETVPSQQQSIINKGLKIEERLPVQKKIVSTKPTVRTVENTARNEVPSAETVENNNDPKTPIVAVSPTSTEPEIVENAPTAGHVKEQEKDTPAEAKKNRVWLYVVIAVVIVVAVIIIVKHKKA